MKEIPLSRGQVALVSDEDYSLVAGLKWYAKPVCRARGGYYAAGRLDGCIVYMHRYILAAGKGQVVDHVDGDGLNNCRSNIRLCTHSENGANRVRQLSKHGLRGIGYNAKKPSAPFRAQIRTNDGLWFGPRRPTSFQAAIDYDREAVRRWGDFARPNFPCIFRQGDKQ